MRTKLKLDLEQLLVDSFDTENPPRKQGTVFGEQCTCWTNCTCPGCPTCDNTACGQHTCGGTCGAHTCAASCYGTCGGSCDCPSADGYCTQWDHTCRNIGTCDWNQGHCAVTP